MSTVPSIQGGAFPSPSARQRPCAGAWAPWWPLTPHADRRARPGGTSAGREASRRPARGQARPAAGCRHRATHARMDRPARRRRRRGRPNRPAYDQIGERRGGGDLAGALIQAPPAASIALAAGIARTRQHPHRRHQPTTPHRLHSVGSSERPSQVLAARSMSPAASSAASASPSGASARQVWRSIAAWVAASTRSRRRPRAPRGSVRTWRAWSR